MEKPRRPNCAASSREMPRSWVCQVLRLPVQVRDAAVSHRPATPMLRPARELLHRRLLLPHLLRRNRSRQRRGRRDTRKPCQGRRRREEEGERDIDGERARDGLSEAPRSGAIECKAMRFAANKVGVSKSRRIERSGEERRGRVRREVEEVGRRLEPHCSSMQPMQVCTSSGTSLACNAACMAARA
jgi:hypothetical protein